MKRTIKYIILIIVFIAIIIMSVMLIKYKQKEDDTSSEVSETEVIKTDILNTLSTSSYVSTALEENKQLHIGYYFEEIYFEENEYIEQGETILKYTNGEYMTAPYNCVITKISVPESESICTSNHYITLQSTETLKIDLQVEESELDIIYVGQEAQIEIETLDNETITGYVTKIDNTASYSSNGSNFGVEVEFENDGEILLGMSAKCSIILEKAENVLAVANEAIEEQGKEKYVTIKNDDGTTQSVEIEVGIQNDAYTQIVSGLNEGDIVIIEEENTQTNGKNQQMRGNDMEQVNPNQQMMKGGENFEAPQGEMPEFQK